LIAVPKDKSAHLVERLQAGKTPAAARVGEIVADGGQIDVIP